MKRSTSGVPQPFAWQARWVYRFCAPGLLMAALFDAIAHDWMLMFTNVCLASVVTLIPLTARNQMEAGYWRGRADEASRR